MNNNDLKGKTEPDCLDCGCTAGHGCEDKKKTKCKKLTFIFTVVFICAAVAAAIAMYILAEPERQYKDAVALMDAGKFDEAISAFEQLDGYKDSKGKIEDSYIGIYGEEFWTEMKKINAGDIYTFGSYEQDNDLSNGKEAIEWIVLDKDGSRIFVVSKYALDCQIYNPSNMETSWETCTLRTWLNNDFLNAAFSAEEQEKIPTVTVSADINPVYETPAGNATQDQLFLMSIDEVNKYFVSDSERHCEATAYAIANGAYVHHAVPGCWWWLRSPGFILNHAALVNNDGSVYTLGYHTFDTLDTVRPAMWIDLYS